MLNARRSWLVRTPFWIAIACAGCMLVFMATYLALPVQRNWPVACSHRAAGTAGMRALSKAGINCFDLDVIRLAEGTLLAAHPSQLQAQLEAQGTAGPTLGAGSLLQRVQQLTPSAIFGTALQSGDIALLSDVLKTYSVILTALPATLQAQSMLLLDLKGRAYTAESIAHIAAAVRQLDLEQRVLLWCVDRQHYDIVMAGSGGTLGMVWGVMDRDFKDDVSAVAAVTPLPEENLANVRWTGASIKSQLHSKRPEARVLGKLLSWLVDSDEDLAAARAAGASFFVTNRPFQMARASRSPAPQLASFGTMILGY